MQDRYQFQNCNVKKNNLREFQVMAMKQKDYKLAFQKKNHLLDHFNWVMKGWNPENHTVICKKTKDKDKKGPRITSMCPAHGYILCRHFHTLPCVNLKSWKTGSLFITGNIRTGLKKMNEFAKYQMAMRPEIQNWVSFKTCTGVTGHQYEWKDKPESSGLTSEPQAVQFKSG